MTTIDLKVISENGKEVFFKIRDTTPLRKVLEGYCDRYGIKTSGVLLTVNNKTLNTSFSSKHYGFFNNQIINVVYTHPPQIKDSNVASNSIRPENTINLIIVSEEGNEVYFKMRDNTPLLKLLTSYCDRQGIAIDTIVLTTNNTIINTSLNAKECRLIDNQRIYAIRTSSLEKQLVETNILDDNIINLRVTCYDENEELFKVGKHEALNKLVTSFCQRSGIKTPVAIIDQDYIKLDTNLSPYDYGMSNNDILTICSDY